MKTFVLAVSIVLVSILFCPMVMAAPSMPEGLQIVQPDPSLPKELSAFFGKWEGATGMMQYFLIVEKIDEEKASIWLWKGGSEKEPGWKRFEAPVIKEGGKCKLWFNDAYGNNVLTSKGEYVNVSNPRYSLRLRRVP
jgi:hypothetical protein